MHCNGANYVGQNTILLRRMHQYARFLSVALLALALSGCYPWLFRDEQQQGNIISTEARDSLELGMRKEDVVLILGSPPITPSFDTNLWVYPFVLRHPNSDLASHELMLGFNDQGQLATITELPMDPLK